MAGLATDALTLNQRFQFKHNMYKLREERNMKPATFAHMVSKTLYEKRFGPYFCEPGESPTSSAHAHGEHLFAQSLSDQRSGYPF